MNQPDAITKKMLDRLGVEESLNDGIEAALRRHVATRTPVVVWRDGKVVELSPESALADHLRARGKDQRGAAA